MKTLLTIAAVCMLGLLTTLVLGQDQPPEPPQVSAANWIPLGDKMGFVVTPEVASRDPSVLAGYFVAWHENSWKRIDSAGAFQFQPLHK
jgi:hypothetical protein